jgi:hypothetical protein
MKKLSRREHKMRKDIDLLFGRGARRIDRWLENLRRLTEEARRRRQVSA